MARLYSQQFHLEKDGTSKEIGSPDAGTIWIVRQINVYNGNSESSGVIFQAFEFVSGAVFLQVGFDVDLPVSAIGTFTWEGRVVFNPGQVLAYQTFSTLGASGCDVYLGGYVLEGP